MRRAEKMPNMYRKTKIRDNEKRTQRNIELQEDKDYESDMVIRDLELATDPIYMNMTMYQKRFIYFLYVQGMKGWTNAYTYKMAYCKDDSFPTNQASLRYYELSKHPKIIHCKEAIERELKKKYDKIPERVMGEECNIAFSDIAEFFDAEGHLLCHPTRLPPKVRATISSLKAIHRKDGTVVYEVSLWNKGAALGRLENMFGLVAPKTKKVEVSGPGGAPIRTENINVNLNYDFSLLKDDEKLELKRLLDKCRIEEGAAIDV